MGNSVFSYAIYTMRHSKELDKVYQSSGEGTFIENKPWRTGERLFREAKEAGYKMPVFFSAAEEASGLIYYAFLSDVHVDDEKGVTFYSFDGLRKITPSRPMSALTLRTGNKPMSNDYIRPYAICITPPDFEEWDKPRELPSLSIQRKTQEQGKEESYW